MHERGGVPQLDKYQLTFTYQKIIPSFLGTYLTTN